MADFSKLKKIAEESGQQAVSKLAKKEGDEVAQLAAKGAEQKGVGTKIMDALSAPQRYLSNKAAQAAGLKPAATSEENYVNLVEKGADALGVPKDSVAGNLAKAGAVAAAEVFGDPLQFVPIGKIAKGIKGVSKLEKLPALAKIAEEAKVADLIKRQRAKQLAELDKVIKPKGYEFITSTSGKNSLGHERRMASKLDQEARMAEKYPERVRSKTEMGNDITAMEKGLEHAKKEGVSKDREKIVAIIHAKARGKLKP